MKLEDATVIAAGAAPALVLHDAFAMYAGVSLPTLLGSAAGSVCALAYYREPTRSRMFVLAAANTFAGAASTIVGPLWFDWNPVAPAAHAPVGFVAGFACRWIIPMLIDLVPALRDALRAWVRVRMGLPPLPPEK